MPQTETHTDRQADIVVELITPFVSLGLKLNVYALIFNTFKA